MLERLPPRERQIIDVLYACGEATAVQVREALKDPPSNSAVRAMLARLELKGFVTHHEVEQRYVYSPSLSVKAARESALRQILKAFFDNSPARAATALLGMSKKLDDRELGELEDAIKKSRTRK